MFYFTKYSKIYYILSSVLIIASVVSLFVFSLKFGIEFTGGSSMEIEFNSLSGGQRPDNGEILKSLAGLSLGEIIIQPVSEKKIILRFGKIDEATHQQALSKLNELSPVEEKGFRYIGPSVGNELKNKTLIAALVVLAAITLYIAFAFRKASITISSWKYGVASLIALFHDILIPLGVFSAMGKFYGAEITIPIVAALLTVLGFSVHDTIVIFDRIRENALRGAAKSFVETVDMSLNQTIGRSVSTVFTTLLVMIFVFFFGGETLKYFSLALIIGIASGAYSSIFIAGPLLVSWKKREERKMGR